MLLTFLQQADISIPIWLVLAALAIPAALVATMGLIARNRNYIRGQTEALLNEKLVAGDLPTASLQTEIKESVDQLETTLENGLIKKMTELELGYKDLSSKVDRIIGHLGID